MGKKSFIDWKKQAEAVAKLQMAATATGYPIVGSVQEQKHDCIVTSVDDNADGGFTVTCSVTLPEPVPFVELSSYVSAYVGCCNWPCYAYLDELSLVEGLSVVKCSTCKRIRDFSASQIWEYEMLVGHKVGLAAS